MGFNSYKDDEQSYEKGKRQTLMRLFSYLFSYKKQICFVLLIMAFCVVVSLLNPLFIEQAIDKYIGKGDLPGLYRLIIFAVTLNLIMILGIKLRMYIMAKVCNSILVTIRQELYTHIQTLDFHFLTAVRRVRFSPVLSAISTP